MVRQHHQLNRHEFEQTPGNSRTKGPGVLQSMGSQRAGHDFATEQQQPFPWKKKKNVSNKAGSNQEESNPPALPPPSYRNFLPTSSKASLIRNLHL